ncbi:YihY/virulence factor BrkB family protein [Melittangium boletus]|uniref:YihY/virulence factor BrkB family protein n=1 Tax=Melittangium boletus TaxID=83453 RepID=UPI003DA61226
MSIAQRGRNTVQLMKRAVSDWSDHNIPTFAAALSYYTIFSIAPVLVIAVSVAGMVFGEDAARGQMQAQLQGLVGQSGADVIGQMMISARKPSTGIFATALGLIALVFGATGVFVQLQDALNHIWGVQPDKERSGVTNFLRMRLLSFAMVLVIGFLLLVSLVVSAVLAALGAWFDQLLPGWTVAWQGVNLLVSFGVITVLFAMMYKILPDTHVTWKDVWLGAAVTSLLFGLGKFGIGLYLGRSAVASSYGAAGSLAVVLLWVYYSAQILFLGAEFTQVYARRHGSRSPEGQAQQVPPPRDPKQGLGVPSRPVEAGR